MAASKPPSPAEIPQGLPTPIREVLERIYRHLRGPVYVSQGGTRKEEFRLAVSDAGRLVVGSWADRDFASRMSVDTSGDVRPGSGLVVTSPDGTEFRIIVSDAGVLSTEAV